jgi:hypothetical protein
VPSRHGSTVETWASRRLPYVDNLKVLLIAGVIAGHAVASYSDQDFWPYAEMNEVELSQATMVTLFAVVAPATLLMIPLLFLVAGLLTPGSLDRKGVGPFIKDRLLRLGVPFAAYVLLLQPLLMYPVHPPGEKPGSYWYEFVGGGDQALDTGPLWFVGVLLIFSTGYAAWVRVRRARPAGPHAWEVTGPRLVALAAVVAAVTFLVRLEIPLGGANRLVKLNLWEWPGCAAVFALGLVGYRDGWLDGLPDRLHRRCRVATRGALLGFAMFAVLIRSSGWTRRSCGEAGAGRRCCSSPSRACWWSSARCGCCPRPSGISVETSGGRGHGSAAARTARSWCRSCRSSGWRSRCDRCRSRPS